MLVFNNLKYSNNFLFSMNINMLIFHRQYLFYQLVVIQFMKTDQDYDRLVTEIQQLKKTCNNEKLAHQGTIDQLQVSYDLNQQLQNVIKTQSITINSLKQQIVEKTNRLVEMGASYETQLIELKQFVVAKDRQLQGFRGSLNVTDYDMIRLRVISELQLVHREKIQELNKQIERLNKLWSDQKQSKSIACQKLQYLKKQLEKQAENYEQKIQQKQKKYIKQSNKLHQKYENERILKKQAQKLLQAAQKRYQNLMQKYDAQISKAYDLNKPSISITNKISGEYQRAQTSRQTRLKQSIQERDKQIESLKRKISKQSLKFQQTINDLEQKLKDSKQGSIPYQEHLQKIRQKQKDYQEIVTGLQKKIRNLKQDNSQEIRKAHKQCERKIQQLRQKMKVEKENYSKNAVNIESPFKNFQQNLSNTETNERQRNLQQKIKILENQNSILKKGRSQKIIEKVVVNQKGQNNKVKYRSESVQIYKIKLNEANQQIVSLLKDKVSLKQQISQIIR